MLIIILSWIALAIGIISLILCVIKSYSLFSSESVLPYYIFSFVFIGIGALLMIFH